MPLHLLRQFGIGGHCVPHRGLPLGRQLAVREGGDLFGRHAAAHASSPSICIRASRPLTSRELSVPTGQPTISAASL